jgi:hypothetical protein
MPACVSIGCVDRVAHGREVGASEKGDDGELDTAVQQQWFEGFV